MDEENKQRWSLEIAEIPEPCTVPWDSMKGNDRVRHCNECSKNVYNISNMTRAEAHALLIDNEGKVCISMLKRADGTIVSDKCPPILKPIRNCWRRVSAAAIAAFALISNVTRSDAGEDCDKSVKPGDHPVPMRTAGKPMMNPEFASYRMEALKTIGKALQEAKITVEPGTVAQVSINADGTVSTCKINAAKMQASTMQSLEKLVLKTKLSPLPKSITAPFSTYVPLSPPVLLKESK